MIKLIKLLLISLFFAATGYSLLVFFPLAWQHFTEVCPNTDLLTWDENIRLNLVFDQYHDFREGHIFRGILPFLQAPTWPPLRPFISLILLFVDLEYPITWQESFLGLFFLGLVFPSLAWISYKISRSLLISAITTVSVTGFLLHTTLTPAYSLSAMLESQGMVMMLWAFYTLYLVYSWTNQNSERDTIPKETKIQWWVSFSLIGLFLTKYPYALLLFIAIFLYEAISNSAQLKELILFIWKERYKGIRRILLVLALLTIFSLPILRVVLDYNLNQRPMKTYFYFLSLLVFLDFNHFLYKRKEDFARIVSPSLKMIYIYGMLPCLIWIFSSPDRVRALLDAQLIVNEYVKSFVLSLFWSAGPKPGPVVHVFEHPWIFRVFFASSILAWILHSYYTSKSKGVKLWNIIREPLTAITIIICLQYLVIDATTGNKQLRHVFPPLPTLLMLLSLWIFRWINLPSERVFLYTKKIFGIAILLAPVSLFFLPNGLFTPTYEENTYLCLKGEEKEIFQPARDLANQVSPNGRYVLINSFHDSENYDKEGRLLASEMDLLLRIRTKSQGTVRNDSKYIFRDWTEFNRLITINHACVDTDFDGKVERRIEALHVKLKLIQEYEHPSKEYCLKTFDLKFK